MRVEKLVDGVGIRQVSTGCHGVGFHGSVAGKVVSRKLLKLYELKQTITQIATKMNRYLPYSSQWNGIAIRDVMHLLTYT